jgi:hypothetical protein
MCRRSLAANSAAVGSPFRASFVGELFVEKDEELRGDSDDAVAHEAFLRGRASRSRTRRRWVSRTSRCLLGDVLEAAEAA